ncbi:hypothetical protein QYQ98_06655 [Corynebacterium sp. P3-F1]|uniref:hypothetical protein n=1 Tax=Corynebacterium sp. P3-F1 TaxID=3059080 RepID=UPI00265CDC97|nr:hypothetical protein [Corynebacterium sp. P3-F1]WKK60728.1 hypothetical protein QYQ98_06655 [Corynebacterium sp. P3-F1]
MSQLPTLSSRIGLAAVDEKRDCPGMNHRWVRRRSLLRLGMDDGGFEPFHADEKDGEEHGRE